MVNKRNGDGMELALDASIALSALGISEWRGGFDWS